MLPPDMQPDEVVIANEKEKVKHKHSSMSTHTQVSMKRERAKGDEAKQSVYVCANRFK
jgi:hypothetical protein